MVEEIHFLFRVRAPGPRSGCSLNLEGMNASAGVVTW